MGSGIESAARIALHYAENPSEIKALGQFLGNAPSPSVKANANKTEGYKDAVDEARKVASEISEEINNMGPYREQKNGGPSL